MPNILSIPNSSTIFFSSDTAGASTSPALTGNAVSLAHNGAAGLTISSLNTSSLSRLQVNGANGSLFAVTDAVTGTVFTVNDASGLPIVSVDTGLNDVVTIGTYGSNALVVRNNQVGIGTTTPNVAALLDITSTTKGFLPPRMTSTQRDAIASAPASLIVYNTTDNAISLHNGTAWGNVLTTHSASFTSATLATAVSDETGSGSLVFATSPTLTTPTLLNASLTGQAELTSQQTGATQYSVATRSMAEDSMIWSSRVRSHGALTSGTTSFSGAIGGITGQSASLALGTTVNSLARISLANNILTLNYSGSSTDWSVPWQIRVPFGSIAADSNCVFRVWTGSHVPNIGVPYSTADGIPIGMSSIGFEFRANPASVNQHQIRLIARDGMSRSGAGYSLTNGSPVISGLSAAFVTQINTEIAAGRTVYVMSGTIPNLAPDSKAFADGAVVISATGTTATLDRNALVTSSVPLRFVYAAEIGTFSASAWVNVGPSNGGLNRQYDAVIENLGNGTANLYCVSWYQSISPPLHSRVPIATLNTGVPSTTRNVTTNASGVEAHVITNGVNAPTTTTSNSVTIFNIVTKIGI
jgi:hypothetical protein